MVGFPLFLGLALRQVDAMHAAVITGVLPLATAPSPRCISASVRRPASGPARCSAAPSCSASRRSAGSGRLGAADGLLLLAVASASIGYVAGAALATQMKAEQVICWVLALEPAAHAAGDARHAGRRQPVRAAAWGGFAYVTLFSMWLGFFAWYRGLALGGTVRVSQVQLVQPFLSLLFAVPVLGERLDAVSVGFALAVIATVFVGRSMPAHRGAARGVPARVAPER